MPAASALSLISIYFGRPPEKTSLWEPRDSTISTQLMVWYALYNLIDSFLGKIQSLSLLILMVYISLWSNFEPSISLPQFLGQFSHSSSRSFFWILLISLQYLALSIFTPWQYIVFDKTLYILVKKEMLLMGNIYYCSKADL